MHYQYVPYLWFLVASALISAVLGIHAWRHRTVPGATPFAFLMLVAVLWAVENALEMAGTDLPTKLFWANAQYLCYGALPIGWLALALQYTGRDRWLTRRNLALLSVEPLITVVLVWTNDLHGLMRRNVYLDTSGPFPVIGKTFGPWFWVHAAYTYPLLLLTIYLLVASLRNAPLLYRRQTTVLVLGALLPLGWNVLYNFGLSPIPRHDIAPAVFSLSGVLVTWGLFRYRLFDIAPIARAAVIEGMDDGLIVLDARNRVVDLNPAARKVLGRPASLLIGRPAEEVFDFWPDLLALCHGVAVQFTESLPVTDGQARQHYDLRASLLTDRRGRPLGRLILLRDITERRRTENQLLQQQRALAVLEERERLARELHDDLGQVLGYINVQAQAIHELLSAGQTDAADAHLARLTAIVQDAHADVREHILNLKAIISPEKGFFPALEQYLQQFERNSGIRTELIVPDALAEGSFEPAVEVQLLRIIQEALTNARKHACAHQVHVTFRVQGDWALVTVEDDGRGFDPSTLTDDTSRAAQNGQHFGLHFMRERAEAVGGNLHVYSVPRQGTRLVVQIPLRREGGDHPMKILLVDDHPLFLEGLKNLLAARGLEVVGTARDGQEALEKARVLHPDVVLMDIEMPRCDGLTATRLIKAEIPDIRIVVLTVSEDDRHLFEAIKSGASGYLLKSLDAAKFFGILSDLEQGEAALSPGLAAKILEEFAHRADRTEGQREIGEAESKALTVRQREILVLVARGLTYKEVAATLHLSERTVKYHMGEILRKLHLENRSQVIAWAARSGLLEDAQS